MVESTQLIDNDSEDLNEVSDLYRSTVKLITEEMIEKDQFRYDYLKKHEDKQILK